ncbi:MAG: hypothetical protein ABGX37_00720 [Methylococcales bacterium]|nr:hypothetical protein [Methyloprofundus sp.]
MMQGIQLMVRQLPAKNSPETVAELTNLSLTEVLEIKNINQH